MILHLTKYDFKMGITNGYTETDSMGGKIEKEAKSRQRNRPSEIKYIQMTL